MPAAALGKQAVPEYPAVTIVLAKRKGRTRPLVSERVVNKVNARRGYVIPRDLNVTVTRNYG